MNMSWVLDPGCGFAALAQRLAGTGWQVASAAKAPLLPGEPEHAVFERPGAGADGGARLHYSFNPVCLLRVLESAQPPGADTLAQLPLAGSESVGAWLAAADERTLWRGVLAASLLGQLEWLPRIEALRAHASPVVARAATAAAGEMGAALAAAAPQLAAASAALLVQQVQPLLLALAQDPDGDVLQALRPRAADHALAFVPSAAQAAATAFAAVWQQPPRPARAPAGARIQCHAAPAGMLASDNALSRPFPGGYRALAPLLQPQRVWLAWKLIAPGRDAGMAYDGLVWLDDHWAWFPKPYRVLAALLRS